MNSHIFRSKSVRSVLYMIVFMNTSFGLFAQNDTIKNKPSWNIGVGFDLVGHHINFKGVPNIYFYSYGIRPYLGYFVTNQSELGVIVEQRFQRTSLENEQNVNGTGIGYYYRYNFTQFDPLQSIFKRSRLTSVFFLEWEHQLSNYRFLDLNERHPDREPLNMTRTDGFVNHHFLPKFGIKAEFFTNFFFNFQVFYHVVNTSTTDIPVRWRACLEYTF